MFTNRDVVVVVVFSWCRLRRFQGQWYVTWKQGTGSRRENYVVGQLGKFFIRRRGVLIRYLGCQVHRRGRYSASHITLFLLQRGTWYWQYEGKGRWKIMSCWQVTHGLVAGRLQLNCTHYHILHFKRIEFSMEELPLIRIWVNTYSSETIDQDFKEGSF